MLFESYHLAHNHIFDVVLIARMLQSQGNNVVIFDIYHEIAEDSLDGVPVMHWSSKYKVPDDKTFHIECLIKLLENLDMDLQFNLED